MPMFTFKKDNRFFISLRTIYDIQLKGFYIAITIQIVLFIYSFFIFVDPNYLQNRRQGTAQLSVDNFFDYSIPLISLLLLFFVFQEDFKGGKYRYYLFFETGKWQKELSLRYLLYIGICILGSIITSLLYYSNVHMTFFNHLIVSLRAIPNILILAAFLLFFTTLTKKIYVGLFISLLYVIGDYLSDARFFSLFSLGANSFNFIHTYSAIYYYLNRIILLLFSIGLLVSSLFIPFRKWTR